MTNRIVGRLVGATEMPLRSERKSSPPPRPSLDTLRYLTAALDRGADVTVIAHNQELTPTQAASFIGISRPHLLTFMDSGARPFTKVETDCRIKASDLLEFLERGQAAHQKLADAPTAERHYLDDTASLSDTTLTDVHSR